MNEMFSPDDRTMQSKRITDELRHNIEDAEQLYGCKCKRLTEIADRIDAAHESEISKAAQLLADAEKDRDFNYANWQDCKQKVLQHSITMDELSAEIERLNDELAHRIELPKDADGMPIRFKDKVTVPWSDKVYEVGGFSYQENVHLGTMTVWIDTHEDGEFKALCAVGSCRHYHAPTVEDVLREFAEKITDSQISGMHPTYEEAIAEYAAKLRLAGSDAE